MHFPADIRHALRIFKSSPGFFATAVLTLALGLTAVSLIFNVVNTVVLRKLPFPNSDRIMTVTQTIPGFSSGPTVCTPSEYQRWRNSGLFQYMTAVETADHKLAGQGHAELITGANVTPDFFRTFGIRPAIGRDFRPNDATPGHDHVIILSHRLWAERFGSNRKIVGRAIQLDGSLWTVIGVAPPRFDFPRLSDVAAVMNWAPEQSEFWTPLTINQRLLDSGGIIYYILGRLRDGVIPEQARVQLTTIASESFRDLAKQHRSTAPPLNKLPFK